MTNQLMFWRFLKRSLIASLFLCISCSASAQDWQQLSQDPIWRALLHIPTSSPQSLITDPTFVAQNQQGADLALADTRRALLSGNNQYLCRFPARAHWLNRQLGRPALDWSSCPELTEYLGAVPVDGVKLVYAYESLSQPASMMGHIFLMLEGENKEGRQVQHSVSFFTQVDGWNVPKLLLEATVTGKRGFFALTPYQELLQQYQEHEQRNVLEYEIGASAAHKILLQLHIWELRQVQFTYFFHRYNCATLTNDLLALLAPSQSDQSLTWLSPLDVLKASASSGLLHQAELYPSSGFRIKMLLDAMRERGETAVDIPSSYMSSESRYLQQSLQLALLDYQQVPASTYQKIAGEIESLWQVDDDAYELDLSNYKDPLQRSNDAQFTVWLNDRKASIEWMPISHRLTDDHRHATAETELRMLAISASTDLQTGHSLVDEVALYDMTSLTPFNRWTKQYAKRFFVGGRRLVEQDKSTALVATIEGGIGINHEWRFGLQTYVMLNLGAVIRENIEPFYGPEIGIIAYEKGGLKTLLRVQQTYQELGQDSPVLRASWQQSWFIAADHTLLLNWSITDRSTSQKQQIELGWRRYF